MKDENFQKIFASLQKEEGFTAAQWNSLTQLCVQNVSGETKALFLEVATLLNSIEEGKCERACVCVDVHGSVSLSLGCVSRTLSLSLAHTYRKFRVCRLWRDIITTRICFC
jgi:hypothetical protein